MVVQYSTEYSHYDAARFVIGAVGNNLWDYAAPQHHYSTALYRILSFEKGRLFRKDVFSCNQLASMIKTLPFLFTRERNVLKEMRRIVMFQ